MAARHVWCMDTERASELVSLSDRVLDVVETYVGEWLTIGQIAERLGARRSSVSKAVRRRMPAHIERGLHPDTGEVRLRAPFRSYLVPGWLDCSESEPSASQGRSAGK